MEHANNGQIVGFLGGSWAVVSRQKEWANVGPSLTHPCWLLSGNVWTDKSGPTAQIRCQCCY